MAIRHWSGRRLVGTWGAGIVAEAVLLALPIAFFAVTVMFEPSAIGLDNSARVMQVPLAPAAPAEVQIMGISSATEISAAPWYAIPMAGAIVFYVFAIPVGLLAITVVWMISRLSGSPPPPSTA